MYTPIREEGATVSESTPAIRQSHRVFTAGVPDGAREGAEDDDHQACRHGLLDLPPTGEDETRHEDNAATHPHEPGEHATDDPDHRQQQDLQKVHRRILAELQVEHPRPTRRRQPPRTTRTGCRE